jgi:hypothetical protein
MVLETLAISTFSPFRLGQPQEAQAWSSLSLLLGASLTVSWTFFMYSSVRRTQFHFFLSPIANKQVCLRYSRPDSTSLPHYRSQPPPNIYIVTAIPISIASSCLLFKSLPPRDCLQCVLTSNCSRSVLPLQLPKQKTISL